MLRASIRFEIVLSLSCVKEAGSTPAFLLYKPSNTSSFRVIPGHTCTSARSPEQFSWPVGDEMRIVVNPLSRLVCLCDEALFELYGTESKPRQRPPHLSRSAIRRLL